MGTLRESKKRETRERISDVATALFVERGFDAVTVDEIAAAARVSTVTVFNYFGRKEDLFFDRGSENVALVREALAGRGAETPVRALQLLAHRLAKEAHPLLAFDDVTTRFWRTAKESAALRARARGLRSEFEHALTGLLLEHAPRDPAAPLVAAMLTAGWCTSFARVLRRPRATAAASRKELLRGLDLAFDIVQRGIRGSTLA